ncbi:mannose-6-phosphate isomerase-like protein (cupin superfamily) [Fictibacillus halophilus]|uniref:Mannose-6-phosphate isomerase-like protein (Cupin superfamily) n=2 Tax=Fictibacillus halophilus TaxID=1610490 RepID=A0ABV2LHR4_9BACL|nr:cupin domain-containing protein [Fictibacillus halophilus]
MAIQREALAISLSQSLAQIAPNELHRTHILQLLEANRYNLQKFSELYISLTGFQPEYRVYSVALYSYKDGLRKVYDAETEGCHAYKEICQQSNHPYVQHVFMQASEQKKESVSQMEWLYRDSLAEIRDYGGKPLVINIEEASKQNDTYRTALWTGEHLQVTLMTINVGDDIGLEVHPNTDQFLRIEEGEGIVQMGNSKNKLDFAVKAYADFAIMIPAGKWHNLTNTGNKPLKLYAIYAPPEHPFGTVHKTKASAMAAEASE